MYTHKLTLMKIWLFILSAFLIISFNFATCESKCFRTICVESINFKLIDKLTQVDLVFGIPRYKLDSMQLNRSPDFSLGFTMNFLGRVGGSYDGLSTSTGVSAVDTAYLRLAYNDIDTLLISYTREHTDCCNNFGGYGKIVSLKYNGQQAIKDGANYKFEKQ